MFTFEITSQIEPSQYTEISGNTKLNPFCQLVLRLTDQITIYRSTSNQDCILTPNPKLLFFYLKHQINSGRSWEIQVGTLSAVALTHIYDVFSLLKRKKERKKSGLELKLCGVARSKTVLCTIHMNQKFALPQCMHAWKCL